MSNDNFLELINKVNNNEIKIDDILSKDFIALKAIDYVTHSKDETIRKLDELNGSTNLRLEVEESYYLLYFTKQDINYISKIKLSKTDNLIESIVIDIDNNEYNCVLLIEYDGSKYYGMQRQKDISQPTIQSEIEDAIFKMINKNVTITSSSRTDRGVHANGQIVSFPSFNIEPSKYMFALNNILSKSIRIKDAYKRSILFNPRFDTLKKTYKYLINEGKFNVFDSSYYLFYKINDIDRMMKELKSIIGSYDFISFSRGENENTIRSILDTNIERNGDIVTLTFTATGFLHNMIRFIVGALIDIDKGRNVTLIELINKKDKNLTKTIADASGLYLDKIYY